MALLLIITQICPLLLGPVICLIYKMQTQTRSWMEELSLVGAYINRGKFPREVYDVYLFPQPYNMHSLTWYEYIFEPCSDHCVMPCKSDKFLVRFYLTHSLCLKHRSSLTKKGPWLYLSNRISTLPKVHVTSDTAIHYPSPPKA